MAAMNTDTSAFRTCLRAPIHEIAEAAHLLDEAVSAHLAGRVKVAEDLISKANMPAIRDWTESIWGHKSNGLKHGGRQQLKNAPCISATVSIAGSVEYL